MERMLDAWVPAAFDHQHEEVAVPAADVADDGESFRIVVDMPGVTREGLEIELEKDVLRVRGKRPATESENLLVNGRGAHRDFERSFALGKDVDRGGIKARLENGVLTINLPRRAEVKAQRIEVEVG